MKVLHSQLKELIPGLKQSAKDVAHALTLTGTMVENTEPVTWRGKNDFLLSLEVRQNRPDCLGVIGVAREVAAYFGLTVILPPTKLELPKKKLSIAVSAKNDIKRVTVIQVDGITNGKSPEWLKAYVEFHGMNSIDLLVDLSNYAMLYTGYPNHLFDAHKVSGGLVWERVQLNTTLETLDGTILPLQKGEHLVISDRLTPLVLASAVGGKRSAISMATTSILGEVAVYNGAKLLQDARSLNVITEAGNRLQKDLATEPATFALEFLAYLLVKFAGGRVASQIFDYYPKKGTRKPIKMQSNLPSMYSGIEIPEKESVRILKNLGFKTKVQRYAFTVLPPRHRTDIELDIDVIEEVVRMKGFDQIPSTIPPLLKTVPDITTPVVKIEERLARHLETLGFDEVRSLPLTTTKANSETNYQDWEEIKTQNSINEELPVLQTSLIAGLFEQQKSYLLKQIEYVHIFEIGKVFGRDIKKKIQEVEMCAALYQGTNPLTHLQSILEQSVLTLGLSDILYEPKATNIPPLANPFSCYTIAAQGETLGIVYTLKPQKLTGNKQIPKTAAFEINLETVASLLAESNLQNAAEMQNKLVVLDVNITLEKNTSIRTKTQEIKKALGEHAWSVEVVDSYPTEANIRHTVRVSYIGLTDEEAKKEHERIL